MRRATFPLAILAALAFGFASRPLVSSAQSLSTPKVLCEVNFDGATPDARSTSIQTWMKEQVAAGRARFLVMPAAGVPTLCAW